MPPEPARPTCDNETHGHVIEAHDRLVQSINALAHGGQVSSYLLTVDEWHTVKALGERINRLTTENVQLRAALEAAIAIGAHMDTCTRYLMGCQCDDCDVWTRALIEQARAALHAAAAPAGAGEMP